MIAGYATSRRSISGVVGALVVAVLLACALLPTGRADAATPWLTIKLPKPGDASVGVVEVRGWPAKGGSPRLVSATNARLPKGVTVVTAVRRKRTGNYQLVAVILRRVTSPARRGTAQISHGAGKLNPNFFWQGGPLTLPSTAPSPKIRRPLVANNVYATTPTGAKGAQLDELSKFGQFLLTNHVVRDPALNRELRVPIGDLFGTVLGVAAGERPVYSGALAAALSNVDLDRIFVRSSGGEPPFRLGTTVILNAAPLGLAADDIDLDGAVDIAVGTERGMRIFETPTQGGSLDELLFDIEHAIVPEFVVGIRPAFGDVNGDGLLDVIGGLPAPGGINGVIGRPGGGFFSGFTQSLGGGVRVATGDVNGDNLVDVIAINRGSGAVTVNLGNGGGVVGGAPLPNVPGVRPLSAGIATVNDDLFPDIAILGSDPATRSPRIGILLGDGRGAFTPAGSLPLAGPRAFDAELARRLLEEAGWIDEGTFGGSGRDPVVVSGDALPGPGRPLFTDVLTGPNGAKVIQVFGADRVIVDDFDLVGGENDVALLDGQRMVTMLNVSLAGDRVKAGRVLEQSSFFTDAPSHEIRFGAGYRDPATGLTDLALVAGAGDNWRLGLFDNALRRGSGGTLPTFLQHPPLPAFGPPGTAGGPINQTFWFIQTAPGDGIVSALEAAGAPLVSTSPLRPPGLVVHDARTLPQDAGQILDIFKRDLNVVITQLESLDDGKGAAAAGTLRGAVEAAKGIPAGPGKPTVYLDVGPRVMSAVAAGYGPDHNLGRDGKPRFATFRTLMGAAAAADGAFFQMYHLPGFGQPATPFTVEEWLRGPARVQAMLAAAVGDPAKMHFTFTDVTGMPPGYPAGRATTPMGAQFDLARQPVNLGIFDNGLGAQNLGDPASFLSEMRVGYDSLP